MATPLNTTSSKFLTRAVRVTQFGAPSVLNSIQQDYAIDLPNLDSISNGPGYALIQVKSIGVNPSETYIRAGQYAQLPQLPYTPGKDCSGVILQKFQNDNNSSEITDSDNDIDSEQSKSYFNQFSIGQRVFVSQSQPQTSSSTPNVIPGAYSEHVLADLRNVYPLPDSLDYGQGATLGVPFNTAWRSLVEKGLESQTQTQTTKSLLIHGASGAVGHLLIQMGLLMGCNPIIGTASTEKGRQKLMQLYGKRGSYRESIVQQSPQPLGCFVAANHLRDRKNQSQSDLDDEESWNKKIEEEYGNTNGPNSADIKYLPPRPINKKESFDIIIEMQAQENLDFDINHLAYKGVIVLVGNKGNTEVSINSRAIMQCEGRITGFVGLGGGTVQEQLEQKRFRDKMLKKWLGFDNSLSCDNQSESKSMDQCHSTGDGNAVTDTGNALPASTVPLLQPVLSDICLEKESTDAEFNKGLESLVAAHEETTNPRFGGKDGRIVVWI